MKPTEIRMAANYDIDDIDFTQTLEERQQRRAYLITYSQCDLELFPTRESFASSVVDAFQANKSKVMHWACCLEDHKDGGKHYHLCLKLSTPKRWKSVKDAVFKKHKINLHFSDQHLGYNVAYKYICKTDKNVVTSDQHPNLTQIGSPKTKKGMKAFSNNAQKRRFSASASTTSAEQPSTSKKPAKARRLSNIEVSDFLVKNNIRREPELMAVSKI